jgi:tetratricopeptide (TPR) repeat protein
MAKKLQAGNFNFRRDSGKKLSILIVSVLLAGSSAGLVLPGTVAAAAASSRPVAGAEQSTATEAAVDQGLAGSKANQTADTPEVTAKLDQVNQIMDTDLEGAYKLLREAVAIAPTSSRAHTGLASYYVTKHDFAKAQAEVDEALRYNPRNDRAYYFQSMICQLQEEYQASIPSLTAAIGLNPKEALYFGNRGYAYYMMKDFAKSLADLNQAVALEPNNSLFLNNRCNTLWELGENEKALADSYKVTQMYPNSAYPHFVRGQIYSQMKDYAKAIDEFTLSLTKGQDSSNVSSAYYNRGNCHARRAEYELAVADYDAALALKQDFYYYNNRGLANLELGRYDRSREDFQKALILKPGDKDVLANLKILDKLAQK